MTPDRPSPRASRAPKLVAILLATAALAAATEVRAQTQPYASDGAARDVRVDASGYGGELGLAEGGSRVLRFDQPIGRVMVGDPKVGDVIPLSDRTLYVLAKKTGSTSLTVMSHGSPDRPLATMDLHVGYDVEGLRLAMRDIMPGEGVEVSSRGDGVVLTGLLSSSAVAARAAALAEQYAPGHVVNLTSIRGAEQVMLSVRVSEVQRSVLKQLGLSNVQGLIDTTGTLALPTPAFNPAAVASLIGRSTAGDFSVQGVFDALDQRGLATTLAEPSLVALSGETAVFFAGGEFPVPVPQENGAGLSSSITIEYKQYGVSVAFTPTVDGSTINLVVAPEVSALDKENGVQLAGFRIPGVTSRRASTTIELRDGQSFAIAGLIRRDFTDNMRGIPGVSNLPIFGALFRSTGYENNETEVVIIVTAHLAKPTAAAKLLVPTDVRQAPSESQLYLSDANDVPVKPSATDASPAAAALKPSAANVAPAASVLKPSAANAAPSAAPHVAHP